MTDLYLGLIALGVLVMAAIQVAAIVAALRTARRVGELASRFEQDVRPIIVNLQKVSEEAARASAQAAAQVDRLDALVGAVARRVEETAATVQQTILQPARDGLALLSTIKNVVASFREAPGRFDAVLTDEAMPGMTGTEMTESIRALRPDIPVVLMSGYVSPPIAARARELGIVEVLAKPLDSRDIARSLARVFGAAQTTAGALEP